METNEASAVDVVEQADLKLGKCLATHRNHPFLRWCCGIGEAGDQGPLYLIGSSIVLLGLIQRNPRASMTGISMLAAVGVSDISKRTVKHFISRSRPYHFLDNGTYKREHGGSDEKCHQSFPSGHVAGSVAAAMAVSRFYPKAGLLSMAGATVIAVSRMLKGAHWPLDIAAGTLIGLFSSGVSRCLISRILK